MCFLETENHILINTPEWETLLKIDGFVHFFLPRKLLGLFSVNKNWHKLVNLQFEPFSNLHILAFEMEFTFFCNAMFSAVSFTYSCVPNSRGIKNFIHGILFL